uniref:Uncharacterized protein n=1 Tax=Cacopsylla melanoneura TaxID=428564 RepID=A0A8D8VS14_9HEMI
MIILIYKKRQMRGSMKQNKGRENKEGNSEYCSRGRMMMGRERENIREIFRIRRRGEGKGNEKRGVKGRHRERDRDKDKDKEGRICHHVSSLTSMLSLNMMYLIPTLSE